MGHGNQGRICLFLCLLGFGCVPTQKGVAGFWDGWRADVAVFFSFSFRHFSRSLTSPRGRGSVRPFVHDFSHRSVSFIGSSKIFSLFWAFFEKPQYSYHFSSSILPSSWFFKMISIETKIRLVSLPAFDVLWSSRTNFLSAFSMSVESTPTTVHV